MKKKIYVVAIILFAAAFFNTSTVKAEDWDQGENYSVGTRDDNNSQDNNNQGDDNSQGGKTSSAKANLPINGGVVFLFVAGIAIGVITLKRFKPLASVVAA